MTEMIPFVFEDRFPVRTLMHKGDAWFVLVDICRVLEIRNSRDAASRLDDDERMTLDRNSNRVANADSIDGCVAASMGRGGERNSRQTANRLGHDENATLDRNRNGVANADSIEG
ncbi:MAG: hypothetical protein HQL39_18765, partial [Alphaproteobacteria bacterium]|nr:hypothetical protein [Alphaproteobacteria bacterium]